MDTDHDSTRLSVMLRTVFAKLENGGLRPAEVSAASASLKYLAEARGLALAFERATQDAQPGPEPVQSKEMVVDLHDPVGLATAFKRAFGRPSTRDVDVSPGEADAVAKVVAKLDALGYVTKAPGESPCETIARSTAAVLDSYELLRSNSLAFRSQLATALETVEPERPGGEDSFAWLNRVLGHYADLLSMEKDVIGGAIVNPEERAALEQLLVECGGPVPQAGRPAKGLVRRLVRFLQELKARDVAAAREQAFERADGPPDDSVLELLGAPDLLGARGSFGLFADKIAIGKWLGERGAAMVDFEVESTDPADRGFGITVRLKDGTLDRYVARRLQIRRCQALSDFAEKVVAAAPSVWASGGERGGKPIERMKEQLRSLAYEMGTAVGIARERGPKGRTETLEAAKAVERWAERIRAIIATPDSAGSGGVETAEVLRARLNEMLRWASSLYTRLGCKGGDGSWDGGLRGEVDAELAKLLATGGAVVLCAEAGCDGMAVWDSVCARHIEQKMTGRVCEIAKTMAPTSSVVELLLYPGDSDRGPVLDQLGLFADEPTVYAWLRENRGALLFEQRHDAVLRGDVLTTVRGDDTGERFLMRRHTTVARSLFYPHLKRWIEDFEHEGWKLAICWYPGLPTHAKPVPEHSSVCWYAKHPDGGLAEYGEAVDYPYRGQDGPPTAEEVLLARSRGQAAVDLQRAAALKYGAGGEGDRLPAEDREDQVDSEFREACALTDSALAEAHAEDDSDVPF